MIHTQKRKEVTLKVILCGGLNAPVSINGYSGCNGTGWYRSPANAHLGSIHLKAGDVGTFPQRCFRCEGWGYQTKDQYYRNKAYDKREEDRLARSEIAVESFIPQQLEMFVDNTAVEEDAE
jgi:hypothetical protein|tara:strand:- start:37 stop:399 length:363 start_codon:yes stop_codon:yes gene_type:complete